MASKIDFNYSSYRLKKLNCLKMYYKCYWAGDFDIKWMGGYDSDKIDQAFL